jgi:hypothetical protein
MPSTPIVRLALAAALVAGAASAHAQKAAGPGLPTWPDAQSKIEALWRATYPTEKVVSIDAKSAMEFSSTERVTETEWWWSETKEINGAFARQPAFVLVERANKSRARFEVAVLYRGTDKKTYLFDKVVLGPVVEMGAPAGAPVAPSNVVAIGLFAEAWTKERPDFKNVAITVDGAPAINHSGPRNWLNYKLVIDAVGTEKGPKAFLGKAVKCKPADYASVLNWDATKSAWVVDASNVRNVNETSVCDLVP